MRYYVRTRNKMANSFLISLGMHLLLILALVTFVNQRKNEIEAFVSVDMFGVRQTKARHRKNVTKAQRRMLTDKQIPVTQLDEVQFAVAEGANLLMPTATTTAISSNDEGSNLVRLPAGIRHTPAVPQIRTLDNFTVYSVKPRNMAIQKRLNPEIIELGIPYRPIGLNSILTSVTLSESRTDLIQGFLRKVKQRIEAVKIYPLWAREAGYEGTVIVRFTILADGKLGEITLINSSGYDILDKAAITTIEKSEPFPSLMDSLNRKSLQIELPIAFRLSVES